ncbi:UNKNOWN [Stylonychia lemnae]|uniref:Uncharacterized protein n=1 Tax=Stylonychia lemnae TaxID=5949 RepID=A0A077ZWJ9_STYLE|nr:UNKNOWN [Stylonychia lemnae]|eukprot:CDW72831.1 UNKNOWN [Stylonychia lemnae]
MKLGDSQTLINNKAGSKIQQNLDLEIMEEDSSLRKQWKTQTIQDYAKNIKELDFKQQCNTKVRRRIDRDYENQYLKRNKELGVNTILGYDLYKRNEQKMSLVQNILASSGLTSVYIISRVPNLHRYVRLSLYSGLALTLYKVNQTFRDEMIDQSFKEMTLKNLEYQELKQLYRAYQIKKSEIEEDKKALAKYKYDPQSYH